MAMHRDACGVKNTRRKEEFSCNFQNLRDDLDGVESLAGKPKLVVLQACRGEGGRCSFAQRECERDVSV